MIARSLRNLPPTLVDWASTIYVWKDHPTKLSKHFQVPD